MPQQNITLAAGEYRLYSTRKMAEPRITTDVEDLGKIKNVVSVYPNPVSGVLNISSKEEISAIYIYSMNGKQMERINSVSGNIHQVNVENFLPGIYLLKMVQKNKIFTEKILIK